MEWYGINYRCYYTDLQLKVSALFFYVALFRLPGNKHGVLRSVPGPFSAIPLGSAPCGLRAVPTIYLSRVVYHEIIYSPLCSTRARR